MTDSWSEADYMEVDDWGEVGAEDADEICDEYERYQDQLDKVDLPQEATP